MNTTPQPFQIVSVVPVDPLAGFSPTGRNLITDLQGRDLAGKVKLSLTSPGDTQPPDPGIGNPCLACGPACRAGSGGLCSST
jgi:hypothetical protein